MCTFLCFTRTYVKTRFIVRHFRVFTIGFVTHTLRLLNIFDSIAIPFLFFTYYVMSLRVPSSYRAVFFSNRQIFLFIRKQQIST